MFKHVTTVSNKFKEESTRVTLAGRVFLRRFNWGRIFPPPVPPPHPYTHLFPPSHKTQNLDVAAPLLFLRSQC